MDTEKLKTYQDLGAGTGSERRVLLAQSADKAGKDNGRLCSRDSGTPCGMLGADRLCMVWQELGERALPDTCQSYPRVSHRFGIRAEQTLSLSCPAAAALALNEGDALVFEEARVPFPLETVPEIGVVAGLDSGAMDEARMLAIQILGVDGLSGAERWVALGILCEQIERCVAAGDAAALVAALQEIVEFVESGEVRDVAARNAAQAAETGGLFAMLLGDLRDQARSDWQRTVMADAFLGLGIGEEAFPDAAEIGSRYAAGLEAMTADDRALLDEYLRRFLLNEAFRTAFPWGRQGQAMKHFRSLVALYGSLRLLLVGMANRHDRCFGREAMVKVVQVFSRLATHNARFFLRAELLLVGSDAGSLGRLVQLTK